MRQIKSFINDAAIQAAVDDKSLGKPYVALDENTGLIDWNGKDIGFAAQYLTIEALESGTFIIHRSNVDYSVNGAAWETSPVGAETNLSLAQGDKVRFRADGAGVVSGNPTFGVQAIKFNVYGNIESLEYGDDFVGKTEIRTERGAFGRLFYRASGLTSAENLILPATTLKPYCYGNNTNSDGMFRDCTSLISAPALPATTLAEGCYINMFYGCTSLETGPDLLFEKFVSWSCYSMFQNCTNLKSLKCLADNPENYDCGWWLGGISTNGTLIKKPGYTWRQNPSQFWQYAIPGTWSQVDAQ
jgi:hypothetical protein